MSEERHRENAEGGRRKRARVSSEGVTTAPQSTAPSPTIPQSGPRRRRSRYKKKHSSHDRFFRSREPKDWSLSAYTEFYKSVTDPRDRQDAINRYGATLWNIIQCEADDCCPPEHRAKATELRRRYKQEGEGSDRRFGQAWVKSTSNSSANTTAGSGPASVHVTTHGPIYYGDVSKYHTHVESGRRSISPGRAYSGPTTTINNVNNGVRESVLSRENSGSLFDFASQDSSEFEEGSLAMEFRKAYDGLRDEHKWKLTCSQCYVEDLIYKALRKMSDNDFSFETQLGRSFTLDVTSDVMRKWFAPDEWAEIKSHLPEFQPAPAPFLESLVRFEKVKSVEDLWNVLESESFLKGEKYDKNVHWDMAWADQVLRNMHTLYDAHNEPLRLKDNAEDFYSTQVWATIIDRCFWDIKGLTVQRKEITCIAGTERKNRRRNSTGAGNRVKLGSRVDGIVRTIEDDAYEYAVMEAGRVQKTATTSKWLNDALKLARAMRDILRRLQELVRNDASTMALLEVPGLLTMGLSLQVLRISRPRGYVCLLTREKDEKVPADVEHLRDLLHLLKCVVRAKGIVKSCFHHVKSRSEGSLRDELFHGRKEDGPSLPWSANSPPSAAAAAMSK